MINSFSFNDIVLLKGYEGKLFEVMGITKDKCGDGSYLYTYDLEEINTREFYLGIEQDMVFHSRIKSKSDKINYLGFDNIDDGLKILNDLITLKKIFGDKAYSTGINKVKKKLAELSQV